MDGSFTTCNGNGPANANNGHSLMDNATPENLTINHIPLDSETLLEINGVRSNVYSNGVSTLLRRDRLDRKSEEATFVGTDNIRTTGRVKFVVFDKDLLVLSGVLETCNNHSNGFVNGLNDHAPHGPRWSINCESNMSVGSGFLKGKQVFDPHFGPAAPTLDVYIAGSFSSNPIIVTRTIQLNALKKHVTKGMLDSIPESKESATSVPYFSKLHLQQMEDVLSSKPENNRYNDMYLMRSEYSEGEEDKELSWFTAGIRVGVRIGLSICVGLGIGVGLLVRTYQGTTRTFRRRPL